MYVAQCHHPPIMGMYTMYHSLMIILVKDLDIFEVFNKIKEFKALIRESFCKERLRYSGQIMEENIPQKSS
jgi:hypothetical protein